MPQELNIKLPWAAAIFMAGGAVSTLLWVGALRQDLVWIKQAAMAAEIQWKADHEAIGRLDKRVTRLEDHAGLARDDGSDELSGYVKIEGRGAK